MEYVKVKDAPGLVRADNLAILSVNNIELSAYRKKRNQQKEIQDSIRDINMLKDEMVEIKSMLGKIIGVLNGSNS